MGWQRVETGGTAEEYERGDGLATVRIRERPNGGFVVRLDRLEQAPEGPAYERETTPNREAAEALADEWMGAHDHEE